MEKKIENKNLILSKDKNEILLNMKSISNFINSKDEITYNYIQFNETLFINHNKWLDDIRKEIKDSIKISEPNINISNIIYDNSLLSLLQKIAKPNNYYNNNNNKNKEKLDNDKIFEKIDELTNLDNLNDMFSITNKCSKYKRDSLLSKNKRSNDKNEKLFNIDNKDDNNLPDENFEIEYNDKDINMDQLKYNKKNNVETMNNQIVNNENSLCTIAEIPSIEEREKNSKASKIKNFSSKQISSSNKSNNINNENNRNINNVVIDSNNSINVCDSNANKIFTNVNDINCFKPLKIIESNKKAYKYNDFSINKINISDNYNINSNNYNNKVNIPFFTEIKNKDYNKEKNNISSNDTTSEKSQHLTLNKSNNMINNQKSYNKREIIFSKFDNNNNNYTQKIEISSLKNKNNVIVIQTSRKKEEMQKSENENLSNDKKNNNKNVVQMLTNNVNYNNLFHSNYVQNIVLSSSKKYLKDKNKKEKEKYEDDFEEYEISDSSIMEEEEEEKDKFIPKWAKDEKYINEKIKKQNNDKNCVKTSFGKFVIENLNLNMIFETHNEEFDIRNSTADWRGEADSLEKDKVTNIYNKEIDDIFPNRKLQF